MKFNISNTQNPTLSKNKNKDFKFLMLKCISNDFDRKLDKIKTNLYDKILKKKNATKKIIRKKSSNTHY